MKNVLLIHGFNGIPKIFEYFKEELERNDYNVIIPKFPVREEISIEGYFDIFDKYKNYFNEDLIVAAHKIFLITNRSNISACKCYEKAGGINKADDEVLFVILRTS